MIIQKEMSERDAAAFRGETSRGEKPGGEILLRW